MHNTPRGWLAAIALMFFAFVAGALPVQAQTPLAKGQDYILLNPPLPTDSPAKVEVIEFFSFACPHCADLAPSATKWAGKLPGDVAFRRVPVSFNPYYALMAKVFYALDAIGELQRLDAPLFDAIHVKGLKLIDDKSLVDWASSQGVDAKKFSDALKAFSVDTKVKQADALTRSGKIPGVPAFVVDGRYMVSNEAAAQHGGVLALTDKVIAMARSEHKK